MPKDSIECVAPGSST